MTRIIKGPPVTKNMKRLMNSKKKTVVFQGAARSSKTFASMAWIIGELMKYPDRTGYLMRTSRASAVKAMSSDLKMILRMYGFTEARLIGGNEFRFMFEKINGKYALILDNKNYKGKPDLVSYLFLMGYNDEDTAHGLPSDYLLIDEATYCTEKVFDQLDMRCRVRSIVCYNPHLIDCWIYDVLIPNTEDVDYFESTWRDNPFVHKNTVRKILSWEPTEKNINRGTSNEYMWKVYSLGVRMQPEGLVYPHINIVEEMPPKEHRKKEGGGMDFGFSVDPTSLVHCCVFNGEIYIDEMIYEKGLVAIDNDKTDSKSIEIKATESGFDKKLLIVADSASPLLIHELKSVGFKITGVKKGPNSIAQGISIASGYKINVTRRSKNIIKEFKSYRYPENKKTGNLSNKPIDEYNHAMDAFRYWAMKFLKPHVNRLNLIEII